MILKVNPSLFKLYEKNTKKPSGFFVFFAFAFAKTIDIVIYCQFCKPFKCSVVAETLCSGKKTKESKTAVDGFFLVNLRAGIIYYPNLVVSWRYLYVNGNIAEL